MTPPASTVAPPAPDEAEVSVFGRGVGECVVVHLGAGDWMVVDSCRDPETKAPIALRYLASLGVSAECVKALVLTHWHDDHISGASEMLAAAGNARLFCSGALNIKEFKKLILAGRQPYGDTGTDEFDLLMQVLKARAKPGGARESVTPIWAVQERILLETPAANVRALSPSDGTISLAHHEIAGYLPTLGPKRRVVVQGPNRLSVVLWVQFPERAVLLGGDLESSADPRTGWRAVVDAQRPSARSLLIKVPHHGSTNAHHDAVWKDMMEPLPIAVCTAYSPSRLPRVTDQERIKSLTDRGYLTSRPQGRKPRRRAAEMMLRGAVRDLRELEGGMGHVRVRFPLRGDAASEIVLEGPAQAIA